MNVAQLEGVLAGNDPAQTTIRLVIWLVMALLVAFLVYRSRATAILKQDRDTLAARVETLTNELKHGAKDLAECKAALAKREAMTDVTSLQEGQMRIVEALSNMERRQAEQNGKTMEAIADIHTSVKGFYSQVSGVFDAQQAAMREIAGNLKELRSKKI